MIRCIAIDDEPLALGQMEKYIEKTPFLEAVATFPNALEAMSFLQENQVDLIFVDINMPDLSGMDMVRALKDPPIIVFTTAYSEYAVEGFQVDALDYLLKPISYPDFLRAAQKAQQRIIEKIQPEINVTPDDQFLFIKSDYKIHRISLKDILYIEGMREYVRIHLDNQKPLMPLISIKKLESKLPSDLFMRVHRSYIVNLGRITTVERYRIQFDDKLIPVSDQYKKQFQAFIDKNFLI